MIIDLNIESLAGSFVVGIDEVGRGCLCGDVVAAAVHIPDASLLLGALKGVRDSKRMSAASRARMAEAIRATCLVGVGSATPAEIDHMNILQATFLAMTRAVAALASAAGRMPDHAIIDGNRLPKEFPCAATALVKGDAKCASIAAASVVAKHFRDERLAELDREFPGYGWAENAGYGTPKHLEGLRALGATVHHRMSFAGVLPRVA
jgi:ribonuclease HII